MVAVFLFKATLFLRKISLNTYTKLNVTNNFLELIFGWNTTSSKTTFVIAVVILQALAISPPMWKPIVKLVYHPLGYSSSIRWFHSSETLYSPLKGQYTSLVTWITRWTIFIWVRFCWIFSNFSKSMRVTAGKVKIDCTCWFLHLLSR